MKITLDIPDELVNEAMKVSHQRTKTAVIIEALEEFVKKHKLEQIKQFKGRVALDINLSSLRKRR